MRRYAGFGLLVALVASLAGCGLVVFSAVEPDARLRPRPGSYGEAIYVEPERSEGEQFYWSETPGAAMGDFEWFDGVSVTADRTFWYFTIGDGVRSPIIEATYVIEDESAPSVSAPVVSQTPPSYWTYGVEWNATAPGSVETQNPFDDVTPSDLLEYAVFSSASDNITTVEEAIANGRVELAWRSWWELEGLSYDTGSGVFADPVGGRLGLRYTAGRPGEQRFFNVFVRDGDGNATGYGTKRFASRSAQSIYVAEGLSTARDRIHLNNAVDVSAPGGEPSFTAYAESPFADGNATFAFTDTVAVAVGRIDDDSFDDLAIVVKDGTVGVNLVRWYRALGNGRFDGDAPAAELMTEPLDTVSRTVAIADFTGDGIAEIIVNAHDGLGNFELRVYDRGGTLLVAVAAKAREFVTGDITGDGLPDIVAWDTTIIDGVEVWINNGGTALNSVAQSWTPPKNFVNAELADINNDGRDDLLVASSLPVAPDTAVEIFLGTATGALSVVDGEVWFRNGATEITDATHVTRIDFDRDGLLDLFIGTSGASSLQQNIGGGTFAPLLESGSMGATDSVVLDANGDGWPDIVEVFGGAPPSLWLNQEGTWLNPSSLGIGSTGTTMVAAGRLR